MGTREVETRESTVETREPLIHHNAGKGLNEAKLIKDTLKSEKKLRRISWDKRDSEATNGRDSGQVSKNTRKKEMGGLEHLACLRGALFECVGGPRARWSEG